MNVRRWICVCWWFGLGLQAQAASPANQAQIDLLLLHNQARLEGTRCGWFFKHRAGTLTWNAKLSAAASQQVKAMAMSNTFSHSAGGNTKTRLAQVGYAWSRYAENIGRGYNTAEDAFAGWAASREHCENIMDQAQRDFGAAHYQGYWSVILAAPKQ